MEKLLFTNSGDLIIAGFHAVRMINVKFTTALSTLCCQNASHFYRTMYSSSNEGNKIYLAFFVSRG